MAESYASALKGILSNLQGNCRSSSGENVKTCKRAMEEHLIIGEVGLSTDNATQASRQQVQAEVQECFNNCRITGRDRVRECNTLCSNSLIQALWKRVNLQDYERIATKYA